MRALVLLFLTTIPAPQLAWSQWTPRRASELDARIHARVNGFPGHVALLAKNLKTGAEYGLRPDERVRTASTIKLPILCALHDQVAQGKVRWDEELTLTEADRVSGSGTLQVFGEGARVRLRDAANLMIVVSDNTATNLVLGRITAGAVNAYLEQIGLTQTKSLRKVRGDGAKLKAAQGFAREGRLQEYQRFGLGVSTPREMVRLLEMIDAGKIVSEADSRAILDVLHRQQYKDGIGRRLPEDWVYSKSGALDALRADVGLVKTPAGTIALALTVDGMPGVDYGPENAGLRLLSDLSRMLVEELTR